jgi:MarR family transcriptional regulator for hemolysin
MQGPAHTMKRTISLRISVLARNLRNYFDRQVAALGVTRSQWAMIAVVATNPGATQRVIADALEMSEASAGRLVDRLCSEGLLTRRSREDDRRAKAIFISDAAEPLLEKLTVIARESEDRMFKGMTDAEIETLHTLLEKVYANLSNN